MRRIRSIAQQAPEASRVVVRAHGSVAAFLCEEETLAIDRVEREIGRRITVESVDGGDHTRFEVVGA